MALAALVFTLVVVILGYRFYAVRVDRDILQADPNRATPATMYKDGVDFMPASSSVLFGYQFKSIAALGPIVGPITAAQFGWLPAILWLVLGVFFIGWVQDYASSMLAMRNEGMTMGGLSYKLISPRARTLLLSFLYIYLLLIMGAFGAIVAPAGRQDRGGGLHHPDPGGCAGRADDLPLEAGSAADHGGDGGYRHVRDLVWDHHRRSEYHRLDQWSGRRS